MDHQRSGQDRPHEPREHRWSDVVPSSATRALAAHARELHALGDEEEARQTAMDAMLAWTVEPGTVEAEEMVELLMEVCGVRSRAILDTVLASQVYGEWSPDD